MSDINQFVLKARKRQEERTNRDFCLWNGVCPECGEDVDRGEPPMGLIASFHCTACKKQFTIG